MGKADEPVRQISKPSFQLEKAIIVN